MSQINHWNNIYKTRRILQAKSDFVKEVLALLKPNSAVLELGCGEGHDSSELSKKLNVTAIDFSKNAIIKARNKYKESKSLEFIECDISRPLPFQDKKFGLVYSRLALHYFDDITTRKVFSEIGRVLKDNGILAFLVKSINDPLYGKGERLEENMYELEGHIRHFFSTDYTKDILNEEFDINLINEGKDEFYGKKSSFIKVLARKKKS